MKLQALLEMTDQEKLAAGKRVQYTKRTLASWLNSFDDPITRERGFKKISANKIPQSVVDNVNDAVNSLDPEDSMDTFEGDRMHIAFDAMEELGMNYPVTESVWNKEMPESKRKGGLTDAQKRKAKARAKRAGRKYPNMVDNMWASRQ